MVYWIYNATDNSCYKSNYTHKHHDKDEVHLPPPEDIVLVGFPIILVIGVLGNVAFLTLIARVKVMRTVTNFYLSNLAIADLLFLVVVSAITLWGFKELPVYEATPFNTNFGCVSYYFFRYLAYFTSISLVTLVSSERYLAICLPLKHRLMNNRQRSGVLTFTAWCVSGVLAIVVALGHGHLSDIQCLPPMDREGRKGYGREEYGRTTKGPSRPPRTFQKCRGITKNIYLASNLIQIIPFCLALILNIILYTKIIMKLKKPSPENDNKENNKRGKIQVMRMLIINAVAFFLCLAPRQFVLGHDVTFHKKAAGSTVNYVLYTADMLNILNSAINPILYGLASPSYRRGFMKAFGLTRAKVAPVAIQDQGQATQATQ